MSAPLTPELQAVVYRISGAYRNAAAAAGEVLAYCRGVDLAIGAYEAACAKLPGARLAVRRGIFTPRKNF